MKNLISYIIIVGFSISMSFAQTDSLILLAEKAQKARQDREALRYYLQAARQAETNGEKLKLARIYSDIAAVYEVGDVFEKSLEYLQKSYDINPQADIAEKRADILTRVGKYQEALQIYNTLAKNAPTQIPNQEYKKLALLRKITRIFQKTGDYESALDNNLQILEIQQNIKDIEGIIIATNNVGYTYKYMQKYPQAIRTFQDVLNLETKAGGKFANNPTSRINLGVTYQNIGDYEACLRYLRDANKIIEKEGNKREMAKMYELLAAAYLAKKNYYNARYYNDKALALSQETQDKEVLGRVYEMSSMLYQVEEKYDKALDDYKKHLAIRDSLLIEERLRQQDLLQQQVLIERTEKEIKLLAAEDEIKQGIIKQLKAQAEIDKKAMQLQESELKRDKERLAREEAEKQQAKQELLLLQQKAEAEKKDRALTIARNREALAEAELQKTSALEKQRLAVIANLEKDKKLQEFELKNKDIEKQKVNAEARQFRYIVSGVIAIGTLIFLFVFIGLVITRKKNQQLAEQQKIIQDTNAELVQTNEEIAAQRDLAESLNTQIAEKNAELVQTNEEIAAQRDLAENLNKVIGEKNESIMASIQYAQKIQQAILVAPEVISQDLPKHFMVFLPRDIVSGDFYFFANTNERIIISAIDCTGHGVPGALMSMIGHEILEDITIMRQIISPEIILEELHKGIRKALKQEQTNNRDGMDLALVSIDKTHKFMEFAGAKNPIIYIQNNEVFHIKGDKMPIGGEQRETTRVFNKHHIPLESPTTFYLFSDGYQDQFGGIEKKKYTIGKMKEVFLQIHQMDMEAQRDILQNNIYAWIEAGKEYQIDDILVIGVSI